MALGKAAERRLDGFNALDLVNADLVFAKLGSSDEERLAEEARATQRLSRR